MYDVMSYVQDKVIGHHQNGQPITIDSCFSASVSCCRDNAGGVCVWAQLHTSYGM